MAALYDWLVLAHVLAAMVWLGALVILGAFAVQILRAGDEQGVGRFLGSLRRIGPLALAPAPITLIAAGLAMVADRWDIGQTWIVIALALFAAAFLIGAAHQSRAAIHAERATRSGDHAEAARFLRRWAWGMAAIVALLAIATWDMVFKPGL